MKVEKTTVDRIGRAQAFLLSLMIGVLTAPASMAGPEDGEIVRGDGSIRVDSDTTTITQFTENLVIDWSTFNVGTDELVNFIQPNSTSTALNRIWDENPSQILGSITANGRVILINPNGIYFGTGAAVDVGALIASGLNVNVDDFMAGDLLFQNTDGSTGGLVVNHGLLRAADGGSVSLFGGAVQNSGTIIANYGSINLAAGRTVAIDFDGDGLLSFAVDGDIIENVHGVDSAVANSGELLAEGGTILLSASTARDVFTQVVNNEGVIAANGVSSDGGRVYLTGQGGDVYSSGVIDASSEQGRGGTVHVLGDRVALHDGAVIDVSGATGGGDVRIGGEFQGDDSLYSAERTFVGSNVTISADATVDGDGGTVIVWSDEVTRFYGLISARGAGAGNGGFAEVSGKGLDFNGDVDLSAAAGELGTLLLDPDDIIINAGTGDGDDGGGSNTDLSSTTINFGDSPATYNIYESELEGVTADIVLQATNSITTSGGPFTVTLQADVDITLETTSNTGAGIDISDMTLETTGNAAIIITAGSDVGAGTADIVVGNLRTGDRTNADTAAITLTADDAITVSGTVESGNASSNTNAGHNSGNVTLTAGGLITVASTGIVRSGTGTGLDDGGATDIASGTVGLAGGSIVIEGSVTSGAVDNNDSSNNSFATSGAVTLTSSAGDIEINGSVSSGNADDQADDANSGDVSVSATGGDIFGTGSISSGYANVVNGDNAGDTATSGDVILSGGEISADGSTAFNVGLGAVTGAGTFSTVSGSLSATASGTGAAGEILLVSGGDLRISNLDTANADTTNVSIEVTGGNLLEIVSGATVALDQDDVVFSADEMTIDASVAATGRVTLTASTASTLIDIGSTATTANTTLELSDAELDNINGASVLQIGDANAGAISVSSAIDTANVSTLHIINGAANITQTAEIVETNLAVTSGGVVTLSDNNNDVDTLAGTTAAGSGNFNFRDIDDLVIGTVDGLTGITSGAGGITLRAGTTLDDLDDATDYLVTSGTLSLRSNGIVGGANAEGLNIDAASVDATLGTGGNNISLTDSGSGGSTTYAVDTGGAGTVSITQDTNNVVLDGVTTTGNLAVVATTGAISQTNGLFVNGTADFTTSANDQSITLGHVDNTLAGAITFTTNTAGTNAGNVVLNNNGTTNLGASTVDGSLTVTSEQEITQSGILTVAGASSFETTANDRSITLNTFANALAGSVSFTTVNGNGDVLLDNGSTTIDFGTSSIDGDLTAVTGGQITQSGALTVTGASNFTTDVDDQSITLSDTGNSFTGAVTVTTQSSGTNAGHVVIDGGTTALDLGASTVAGNLSVTGGGGISQSGALTVAGAGDFTSDVADQAILLGNATNAISGDVSFSTLGTAGDVTFDNGTTGVVLAASTVNGALDVTTGGTISQSGALTVSGTSSFTTDLDDQSITLTDTSNDFTGAVSFTTQTAGGNTGNVSISSGTALDFGASTIAGFLTATSGGGITQSGSLTVAGVGVFTTNVDDQAIVLDDTANAITGAVSFTTQGTTADVTFDNGTTAVDLATSNVAGSLAVTSGSTIGQSGAITVSGSSSFTTDVADQAITLTDPTNAMTGAVSFSTLGTSGDVSIDNGTTNLDFGTSAINGNLVVVTGGTITQSGALDVTGTADFTTDVDDQSITLANGSNDIDGTVTFTTQSSGSNLGNVQYVNGDPGTENDGLTVGASTVAGSVNISDDDTIFVSGSIDTSAANAAVTLVATSGISLVEQGILAGSGNVSLTASSGDILDFSAGADTNANITTTGQVSLTAGGSIGGGVEPADFDVSSTTDLVLSAGGNIYVSNDVALSSFALTWTPAGNVFSLTGATNISLGDDGTDTTLATVNNGGSDLDFSLATTSGDLYLDDGAISGIGAGSVSLTAQSGSILDSTPGIDGAASIAIAGGSVDLSASGTIGAAGTGNIVLDVTGTGGTENLINVTSGGNIDLGISGSGTARIAGITTTAGNEQVTLDMLGSVSMVVQGTGDGYVDLDSDDLVIDGGTGFLTFSNTDIAVDSLTVSNQSGVIGIVNTITANGDDGAGNGISISTTGNISGAGTLVTADVAGTAGDITLTANRIGSSADPLDVVLGTGTDAGELYVTTTGAATVGGAYFASSGQALEIGSLSAANANTFSFDNTNGDILFINAVNDANIDLSAITNTSGGITFDAAVTAGQIFASAADDVTVNAAVATAASTSGTSGDLTIGAGGNLTGTAGSLRTGNADDSLSGDGSPITSGDLLVNVGGTIDNGVTLATGDATDTGIIVDTASSGNISLTAASIGSDSNAVTVDFGTATATNAIGVLNIATTGGAGAGGAFIDAGGTSRLRINNLSTASSTAANEFNFINNGADIEFVSGGVYSNTDALTLDVDALGGSDNVTIFQAGTFGAIEITAGNAVLQNQIWSTADNLSGNSGSITINAALLTGGSGDGFVTGGATANGAVNSGSITVNAQTSGNMAFATGSATDTSGGAASVVGDISLSGGIIGSNVNPVSVLFGSGDTAGQLNLAASVSDAYVASTGDVVVGDLTGNANFGSTISIRAASIIFDAAGTYTTIDDTDMIAAATSGGLTFGQAMSVGTFTASANGGDVVINNTITANDAGPGNTIDITTTASGGLNGTGSLVTADQTVANTVAIMDMVESGSISVDVIGAIEGVSFQTGSATVTSGEALDFAIVGDISLAGSTIGSLGAISVEFGTPDSGIGTIGNGVLNLDTDAAGGAADISISTTSDIYLGTVTTGAGADDVSIVSSDSAGSFQLTTAINAGVDATLSGDNFSFLFADSGTPTTDSSFNNNGFTFDIDTGSLSIIADSPTLSGVVDASGGVTVGPADAGSSIGLGTGAGVFSLDNATINTLTIAGGGSLTVGSVSAGVVTIDDVVVGGTDTLEIITGSTVNDDDDIGPAFSGGTLVITAGGNIGNLGGAQGLNLSVANLEFSTTGDVVISENDAVQLQGTNTANGLALTAGGAISDAVTATLNVTGLANFSGSSITLGDQAGDAFNAGSLTFNSTGAVDITENSATLITGTNTADSLALNASGTISDASGVSLTVTNNASFTANNGSAQDITLGDNAGDSLLLGGLTFAGNNVDIETDGSILLQNSSTAAGTLILNANAASDDAGISENGSASLNVTGNASFLAESSGIQLGFGSAGTFNFGSLTVNTINGGNAVVVEDSAMLLSGTSVVANFLGLLTESGGITDDGSADLTVTNGFAVGTADGSDIVLDDNTHNFGSIGFAANGGLVEIHEASDTLLDLSLMDGSGIASGVGTLTLVSTGAITDDNADGTDSLAVSGAATFSAGAGASDINIGDATNGHTFGSLTFSGNNVSIIENDSMQLTGTNAAAGTLSLTAAGAITDAAATSLSVTGNANFLADVAGTAQVITLGDDAGDTTNFGSLTFDGSVVSITEDSETVLAGASSATALNLASSNGIVDSGAANVTVTGTASFSDTGSAGIVLDDTYSFGTVTLNTGAGATLVEVNATQFTGSSSIGGDLVVNSGGSVSDSLTSSVNVTGNADISATSIVLGNDLGDTFNAGSLTLSATGNVSITEDSGTQFSGANTIGGSMTIISSGAIDDDGTGSIAVTNTTNFNAGSGNNVTLDQAGNDFNTVVVTAANNVTLVDTDDVTLGNATVSGLYDITASAMLLTGTISANTLDFDASGGVGAINQSAGTVTVAGLATFAAQTTDNVVLNQAGNNFSSVAVTTGNNVIIRDDAGGIALAGVIASGGAVVNSNGGAITDAGNDTAVDIAGTSVTLNATDGAIGAAGANGSIDIDAAIVNASTTDGGGGGGGIYLNSVSGATVTFNTVTAAGTGNDVELLADNSIGLGSITADDVITVRATSGNIDDSTDDDNADLTATSVVLTADAGNIGGAAPQPGVPVDTRRDIEINAGSISLNAADTFTATVQSISGAAVEISSTGGAVDVLADNTIVINSLNAGNNDDVTLRALAGDIIDHADDNVADIVANNITLTADFGDIGGNILAAPTGNDPENEIEVDPSGTLTLSSASLFLNDLSGNLVTLNFTGQDFSYTSSADILVGLIDATGTVTLTTTLGSINDATAGVDTVSDINGTVVTLNAADEIGGIDRLEINSTSLAADVGTAGDIVILDIGGTTLANLDTTSGNIDISSDGSLEIDTVTTNGSGTVDIVTTAGSLTDVNGTASNVNGTDVTLAATAGIGSLANAINTTATTLDLSSAGNTVNVSETDGVDLVDVSAQDFLLATAGAVTDSGNVVVTGTTAITAGSGNDITLDSVGNDFGSIAIVSANNVSLVDTNAINFGGAASSISGTLDVQAGGAISDSSSIAVAGLATFDASGNDVILDTAGNDFASVATSNAANVTFSDTNAIQLGSGANTLDASGNLVINATGVTQGAALNITSSADINSSGGNVILTDAANDFGGSVSIDAVDASIVDNGNLDFAASTITGNLSATSAGTITDSGVISVAGEANLDAGGTNTTANAITLDGTGAGSLFGSVSIAQAGNVALVDQDGIQLGNATGALNASGTLTVTANNGSITDGNNVFATDATFNAGTFGITLDNANDVDSLSVTAANGVIFNDIDGIDLAGIASSGAVDIDAGGAVTTSGTISSGNNGAINVATTSGGITIDNAVTANGSGSIILSSTDTLTVNAALASTSGSIDLDAVNDLSFAAAGDLSTGSGGTIDVTSAAGSVLMNTDAVFDATVGGGTGAVSVLADTNVALGSVVTGGLATVQATTGGISDSGNDIVADVTAATANLSAATGIGSTGTAGSIDIAAATLSAVNSTSGGVFLNSVGGSSITVDIDAQTAGNVEFVADGDIHVGLVQGTANVTISSTAGSIYDADSDEIDDVIGADVVLSATGDIGGVDPTPGAAGDVEDQLEVNATNSLSLTANSVFIDDTSGNQLTLNFTGTNFEYSSDGNILVGFIDATGTVLLDTSNGWIRDDGADAVDINGSTITLAATADIGDGAALTTSSGNIQANASGNVDIDNSFAGAVSVTGIDAGAGNISFDQLGGGDVAFGSLNGANITISGTAGVSAATVTGTGGLFINADNIAQTGTWTAASLDLDAISTIDLASAIDVAASADIDSGGLTTVAAAADITAGGNVSFGTVGIGGLQTAGDITTQAGTITFNNAVTLTGNVLLDTDGGTGTAANIVFQDTLDGGFALNLAAGTAGDVSFNGAIGATSALGDITVVADQVIINSSVNTLAGGDLTITNGGLLTLANAAVINLGGNFLQNGTGTTSSGADITTTGGNVSFGTDLALTDGVNISAGSAAAITFDGSITGAANDMTVSAGGPAGTVQFNGTVSGVGALAVTAGASDVNADVSAGSIALAGNVDLASNVDLVSAGSLDIGGALVLSGAGGSSLLASGGDAGISIGAATSSSQGQSLTVNSSGDFSFTTIDLGSGIADLQVDVEGDTNFSTMTGTGVTAASVTLAGGADGNDRISVGSVTSTTGDVSLASSLQLGTTLTIDSANDVTLAGDLGGVSGAGLVVDNVGTFNINGDIQLVDAVLDLGGAATFTGTRLLSNGTGPMTLTDVTSTGTLDINSGGTFTLAGNISVGNFDNADMSGAMLVNGATSITTANSDIDLSGFTGVDASGAGSLALSAGTATISLPTVGGNTALGSLGVTASQVNAGNVTTTGDQAYTGAVSLAGALSGGGSVSITGPLTLAAASSVSATNVSIDGSIDGAQALTLAGVVDVTGGMGQGTALSSLTVNGTSASFGGAVSTAGAQTYNSDVTLNGDLDGASLVFAGAVSLPAGSTMVSDTIDFNGGASSVSGNGVLTLLPATTGASIDLGGTSGTLDINTAALDGYQGGISVGGTVTDNGDGTFSVSQVAGSIQVSNELSLGGGALTLVATDLIDLVDGRLAAPQVVMIAASSANGQILNNGGSNTLITANDVILVAGTAIGSESAGGELQIVSQGGLGTLEAASSATNLAIFNIGNSFEELTGQNAPRASAIAQFLGIAVADSEITNSAQRSANREQSGGLTDEGFIDSSLFEDISLYEVLGTGIALPADQSEEGYFESDGECDPEVDDCGEAGGIGAFMPY